MFLMGGEIGGVCIPTAHAHSSCNNHLGLGVRELSTNDFFVFGLGEHVQPQVGEGFLFRELQPPLGGLGGTQLCLLCLLLPRRLADVQRAV